ncbi:MAG: hypothetical protein RL102_1148 [Actinomycetota bacterium]|jgi:hypothetical protein
MFCTNCGSALGESSAFCTSCGAAVAAAASAPAPTKPKKTKPSAEPITSIDSAPAESSDPYKPTGMSHADYAYEAFAAGVPKRKTPGRLSIAIVTVVTLVTVAGTMTVMALNASTQSPNPTSTQVQVAPQDARESEYIPTGWAPGGFSEYSSEISYAWAPSRSVVGGQVAIILEVSADCDLLESRVEFLDRNGVVVDYGVSSYADVTAGAQAIFNFRSYNKSASSAYVDSLTCD